MKFIINFHQRGPAMKVKTTMRQMKDAKVSFISLVTRGANRIPFRVLKSQGEDNMLDLSQLRHVFKNEPAPTQAKPISMGFAAILRGGKPAPQSVVKAAPVQPVAKHVETNRTISPASSSAPRQSERQQQQVQEERQRQGREGEAEVWGRALRAAWYEIGAQAAHLVTDRF